MSKKLGFSSQELEQPLNKLLVEEEARDRCEQIEQAGYRLESEYRPTAAGLSATGLAALDTLRTRPRNSRHTEIEGPVVTDYEDGQTVLGIGIYRPATD